MPNGYESVTQFIGRFRTALTNGQNNERLAQALQAFGYDAAKWAEGEALMTELETAVSAQQTKLHEQKAATAAVQDAQETAESAYSLNRTLAKRLFQGNPLALSKLRLDQAKPRRRLDFIEQATHFYDNLLADPDYLATMGQFGRTAAGLGADRDKVAAILPLHAAKLDKAAEAQAATQNRDDMVHQARIWLGTLLEVAPFALTDDPQLLEALGIQV